MTGMSTLLMAPFNCIEDDESPWSFGCQNADMDKTYSQTVVSGAKHVQNYIRSFVNGECTHV
jgi:hypothetical protein